MKKKAIKHAKVAKDQDLPAEFSKIINSKLKLENTVFLCIGTDRSTGDSYGPMVGTMLTKMGYPNVLGTLDNPVHAVNLQEIVATIPKKKKVIAIDACLGQLSSVESIGVSNIPMKPGAGVQKDLGEVGDYSISGIVNVGGFMEYFVLQNTRLSKVIEMAERTVDAISKRFPLSKDLELVAASKEI